MSKEIIPLALQDKIVDVRVKVNKLQARANALAQKLYTDLKPELKAYAESKNVDAINEIADLFPRGMMQSCVCGLALQVADGTYEGV